MTRLRAVALPEGCSKVTLLFFPMENPCQSMTMFCDAWFIVMSVSVWLMEPLPAVTLPPVGRVSARVEDVIVKSRKEKIHTDKGFTKAFLIETKQ